MLLPGAQPHHDVCVQGLGGRIVVVPIALLCRLGVPSKLGVDAGVGVRVRPGSRVVDVVLRSRLPAVTQGVPSELVDLLALMRSGLRGEHRDG